MKRCLWSRQATAYGRALLTTTSRTDLADLLLRIDVPHLWSPLHRGYGIDTSQLTQVEAAAEAEGWIVRRRTTSGGGRR